jgi:hypothetical protein
VKKDGLSDLESSTNVIDATTVVEEKYESPSPSVAHLSSLNM